MVDASLVLDAIVAVSIAAGAFFAVMELRSMSRDRKTDIMMRCMEFSCTREYIEIDRKISNSKALDAKGLEHDVSVVGLDLAVTSVEFLAFLARRNLIDRKLVLEFWPTDVAWKKLRPWVIAEREKTGIHDLYCDFEWLATVASGQES